MIALERVANALSEIRSVHIDPRRCLPCRSSRATCTACADICPEGAISLGRSPAVQECSTCGLCAAVCRADAIRLDGPSDQELLQRFARLARKAPRLTVGCVHDGGAAGAVQVGCLGRLSPELLLAAAACGFREILLLNPEGCGDCPRAAGRDRLRETVAAARAALDALGKPCRIRLERSAAAPDQVPEAPVSTSGPAARPTDKYSAADAATHPTDENPRSDAATHPAGKSPGAGAAPPVYAERRAFLLSALDLLRQLFPTAQPKEEPDLLAPSASRRRELLLWALEQLAADALPSDLAWGEGAVRLTGTCHQCGVCVRLCPNGALTLDEAGLHVSARRCHACGLCTQVCPTAALAMGPPPALELLRTDKPLRLGFPQGIRCSQCGGEELAVLPAQTGGPVPSLCLPCALRPPAGRQAPPSSEVIQA